MAWQWTMGSLLSVCGDSWFILCAMIPRAPQVCSLTQPQSLISLTQARLGCSNQLSNTHTPHSCFRGGACHTFLHWDRGLFYDTSPHNVQM